MTSEYVMNATFVCVDYTGRIGNLMFQYAFHYALSKRDHLKRIVPSGLEINQIFEIPEETHCIGKDWRLCDVFPVKHNAYDCAYDPLVDEAVQGHTTFTGYFQSWVYWNKYENQLRKIFTFKPLIQELSDYKLTLILEEKNKHPSNGTILIGVHVRRGDLVNDFNVAYGYKTATKEYVNKAMTFFRDMFKDVLFIVASNDFSWTYNTIGQEPDVYMLHGYSAAIEMAILARTNHTIMTVGTFGWWLAWLTNGKTIYMYFSQPFAPNSSFSEQFNDSFQIEHIYPDWMPMYN